MKFIKKILSLFGVSEFAGQLDHHILDENAQRRRFFSPRSAASQLFQILNAEKRAQFAKIIQDLNNEFTLVRFAMIGQELRVLAYRAATDLGDSQGVYSVYDDSWDAEGIFHYLVHDGKAELLIRNSQPHLQYDSLEPVRCWVMPLTAMEIDKFQRNWLPTPRPLAVA